ncbi:helix-turn-helix transcriptional regulator [Pseudalkalibacillus decolorationis]|uniref:helix-turn-helix transcriptional regulator n=1 Tax=Pseudalkalibacillus decolorationis TaxID=163879 RepID=UPI0021479529|nr:helix-turn-helix transcriptional regulator [Pseudalkalibacillus decolorationis]
MNNRIKIARVGKSLTQVQLAKKVGVTRQTIGLIEKGQYNPSLQLCISIAKTLEKTLDELFWEDQNDG